MPITQVRSKQQLAITDNLDFGNAYKGINLVNPTNPQDAATKSYVDATKQGLDVKDSVRVTTTANITLSGLQTIDGVSVIAGDRVLVKNQTAGQDNGIYVVSAGAWSRSDDANTNAKVTSGMFTFVEVGTLNADSGWVLTTDGVITLGTTALSFTQFSGAGQVEAGNGLTKTGNTLNVETASTGRIVVNADNIDLAVSGVAAAQYGATGFNIPNITIDTYGRTTLAANRDLFGTPIANLVFASPDGATGAPTFRGLVANDIPNLPASKITTGQLLNARGGTGLDTSAAANGTLLIGNGSGFALATLTAVNNRTLITNGAGSITIDISANYVGQNSIVTLGTITTGIWQGTAVGAAFGGTGLTTYAVGDLIFASASTTLARLADVAVGNVLLSGGVGVAPSYGKVQLAAAGSHVTGILPVANGGTGLNTSAAANGQLLIGNGSGFALANLTAGTGVTITNGAGTISIAVNSATFLLVANYVVRESPTGTINGTNAAFTLAATPVAGTEQVYVNGILQNSGAGNDYTISGATITFLAGAIPQTGDVVRVTYLK
jgi:phage-related tail fiber protein